MFDKAKQIETSLAAIGLCFLSGAMLALNFAERQFYEKTSSNVKGIECQDAECSGLYAQLACVCMLTICFFFTFVLTLIDKPHKCLFIVVFLLMLGALIAGIIGMGMLYQVKRDEKELKDQQKGEFYQPFFLMTVKFWLIEVFLMFVGMINLYIIFKDLKLREEKEIQSQINVIPIQVAQQENDPQ